MAIQQQLCQIAEDVLTNESQAITNLIPRLGEAFSTACELIMQCDGRVIVTGMGKSGHIGNKIAATLASTGTPAFFVHPGEASHGDLGMITHKDVVLALSYSGTTDELLKILPIIKRLEAPLISFTGNAHSPLANAAQVNLDISITEEACPLGLAPTSSTTAMLAMGDALAIALLESRGFTAEDFALSHPGGNLGRRLTLQVEDVMHKNDNVPWVHADAKLSDALIVMTEKCLGMTTVITVDRQLLGIFTDGDLRRALESNHDFHNTVIEEVMTANCKTVAPKQLAFEALQFMEKYLITSLPVVDDDGVVKGVIHMHDLLRAGVI